MGCEQCGAQRATVQHRICQLPRILMLHLKRFEMGAHGVRKRTDVVQPVHKLSLDFCVAPSFKLPPSLEHYKSPDKVNLKRSVDTSSPANMGSIKQARRALSFCGEPATPPRVGSVSNSGYGRSPFSAEAVYNSSPLPLTPRVSTAEFPKRVACRYWRQGHCRNGVACAFSHDPIEGHGPGHASMVSDPLSSRFCHMFMADALPAGYGHGRKG